MTKRKTKSKANISKRHQKYLALFLLGVDSLFFLFALPFFLLFLLGITSMFFSENDGFMSIVADTYHHFHEGMLAISKHSWSKIILFSLGAKFIMEIADYIIVGLSAKKSIPLFIEQHIGREINRKALFISGVIGVIFFASSAIGSKISQDSIMGNIFFPPFL